MKPKQIEVWEDCICGNKISHTKPCKREHWRRSTLKKYVPIRRERRHQLRKEHRCIICAQKVRPVKIYRQYYVFHKAQQDRHRISGYKHKSSSTGVLNEK